MQGHIYRRQKPDGSYTRWRAVIDLPPDASGRRRQRTTSHDTKRDAQAWLARTTTELRAGETYDNKVTVAQYLTDWLSTKQAIRPSTRLGYARHIEQIFIPELSHLKLADLRAKHIAAVFQRIVDSNHARERPINARTQRSILATLNSALNTAVRQGLIRRNPAATVELPRPEKPSTTVWSRDEAALFLTGIHDDHLHVLYRLLLLTGMRRGEGIGLQWGDLALDTGTLTITRQVTSINGQLHVGPPKSDSGRRTIAVDKATLELLKAMHRRAVLAHPWEPDAHFDTRPAFPNDSGGHYSPTYVSRHFLTLVNQLGLPRIRLHDLRHTSASLGLEGGESLLSVSRRLGHSSISITADVYSQITPAGAERAADHLATTITGT
ncbi:tyrosine-type recombinase/integrase [Humibacillus xanthopallidus]|uniref:tyrosine-type recombinase/integrase n=1 Tax=Humibacillus xanthopallidus TaxID=412689 RepID=UPI00384BA956